MHDKPQANESIGIFDSGIGGLSVARAVVEQLPNENIIYFGDTAHLPYGEKSTAALQSYAVKIAHLLLEQGCKTILIACNSASAAAYELVKEYVGVRALVINVIDPVVRHLHQHYHGKCLGLIGTKQTVNSQIYLKKIEALNPTIALKQHATPLLAAAIEEQFSNQKIMEELLREYLMHPNLSHIEGLVLACTHYPLVKHQISAFYQNSIEIIDASDIVAHCVKSQLERHQLLAETNEGRKCFYISDYTDSFALGAKLFFNETLELKYYPLWE